jgi:hypothetical protein
MRKVVKSGMLDSSMMRPAWAIEEREKTRAGKPPKPAAPVAPPAPRALTEAEKQACVLSTAAVWASFRQEYDQASKPYASLIEDAVAHLALVPPNYRELVAVGRADLLVPALRRLNVEKRMKPGIQFSPELPRLEIKKQVQGKEVSIAVSVGATREAEDLELRKQIETLTRVSWKVMFDNEVGSDCPFSENPPPVHVAQAGPEAASDAAQAKAPDAVPASAPIGSAASAEAAQ